MKKLLLLSLVTCFAALSLRAGASESSRPEYVTRIESCEAIIREFMANPELRIPDSVLQGAKAIIIVNQFKAGFFLGVQDGYATIMVKRNGHWSLPVLLGAGEVSFGFQAGANAVETVLIVTDTETPRLLFKDRFHVGIDAKAVAGPKAAEAEKFNKDLIKTPVLVYTKAKGLYAGATVKTGWIQRNDAVNFVLYHTNYTLPELLYSDWVQPVPEVVPLMQYIQQIAP